MSLVEDSVVLVVAEAKERNESWWRSANWQQWRSRT